MVTIREVRNPSQPRAVFAAGVLAGLLLSVACVRQTVHLDRAPAKAPKPATAVAAVLRRQIVNAADAGEGDAVVNQLRRRMAADPADLTPRLELADYYGKNGFPELQLEHLRLAAERFPESAPARLALGQSLRRAGLPGQAAQSLEGLATSSSGIELLNLLGICYDESGDWKAGEQAFRRALALGPGLDYLHSNLGYNLLEQQRVAEAVAEFGRALKQNPRSVTARNNLGLALLRSPGAGVAEALAHFETVTDAATANSNLAAVLIEQQRYDESRRLLQAALDYNRSHAAALANLRLVAELDGKPITWRTRRQHSVWLRPLVLLKRVLAPDLKPNDDRQAARR